MITLLKYDREFSETRNYISLPMENLMRICLLEKENSFLLYKIPLKTESIKHFTNRFGVKHLSQINFSKIEASKVLILNPSLLEKDPSGMNRLFQYCQDNQIDIFTYIGDSFRHDNIVNASKEYDRQIFEISEKTGLIGVTQHVKRDMVLRDLVS